nr:Na/Pi cotransporter family protein [Maliibacterium massiliense]
MSYTNLLNLAAGLGFFLYGMDMMSNSLKEVAGSRLRKILGALTTNRFLGLLVGMLFTAIIQSSSATTVMVVGFVNAGVMNLMQAVGVIMGANIGTTITGQLIALKLDTIAPILLLLGVGMVMFTKRKGVQGVGRTLAGFGMLFVGLGMMSGAMKGLQDVPQFVNILATFDNPFLGVLAGAVFTAIIQSSSASVGILQVMVAQGLVKFESAVFIIMGMSIGTCVTAMLACIGTNKTAKQAAAIHLIFNILGSTLMFILLQVLPVVDWIKALAPNDGLVQVANANTIFKVAEVIIFFPFAKLIVKLAQRVVPGKEMDVDEKRLMFVDERMLRTPTVAVEQTTKEVKRMGDMAMGAVKKAMEAFFKQDTALCSEVEQQEDVLNFLNHEVTRYLVRVNQTEGLLNADAKLMGTYYHVVNDMERIGDHAENLVEAAQIRIEEKAAFSESALEELQEMSERVFHLLDFSLHILQTRDTELTLQVAAMEQAIDTMEKDLRNRHIERLNLNLCQPRSGVLFIEMISNLERVADHATNIAYSVLDAQ